MVENPQVGLHYVVEDEATGDKEVVYAQMVHRDGHEVLAYFVNSGKELIVASKDLHDDPEFIVHDAYMNGYAEETIGTTQYGSGHYVFEEVNGKFYALQTISTGATYLIEYENKAQWDVAQLAVLAEYAELENEDGELII